MLSQRRGSDNHLFMHVVLLFLVTTADTDGRALDGGACYLHYNVLFRITH